MAIGVGVLASPLDAPERGWAGLTLQQALSRLNDQGVSVVFSTALVRPEMRVDREPEAHDPRNILQEILEPHGLDVQEGPGGRLVVVRAPDRRLYGAIRGRVTLGGEPGLIPRVRIEIVDTEAQADPDEEGWFLFTKVPVGLHSVVARGGGTLPQLIEGVVVEAGQTTRIDFDLVGASTFLSEIVVTPSHFRILEDQAGSRQFLSREEVSQMPHVADDLYRAVKRLPGASGGDVSAQFNVRGGATDEMLVILDGLEIYEPFHLKDFQNIFSTVDAEAIGGVDFLTGGFPVEYGDRMSGVMDISTATPRGPPKTSLGISTINARILSEGTFNDEKGSWLISGRAWYPTAVLKGRNASADEILSDYYDVLAKVEHSVGERSTLSANALLAYDDLGYRTEDFESLEQVRARYKSSHLWFNLKTAWNENLVSRTLLSSGAVRRNRVGSARDVEDDGVDIDDQREFDFLGLKQDWTFSLNRTHLLKWGFDVKHQEADYDYLRRMILLDPDDDDEVEETRVLTSPESDFYAAYFADRIRLSENFVAELGLRWDKQVGVNDHQVSPRVNLRYAVGADTVLRFGWGQFHQSQRLNELQVEDGIEEFYPAQLAEHWLASIEHRFAAGTAVRVEAYRKELKDPRPRYENLFSPLELFPEARRDRILVAPDGGRSQGVEVLLKQQAGERFSWWFSYVLARVEDSIDGEMVPRSWDQRHAASFGLN
ncbi:MAG: TonB-dependent receptor, partial [Acidobacteria bacterium]|nr:TonB-dependent receptor [Acidobacteriota bacterium]